MNTIGNAPFNVTRLATSVVFACTFWRRRVDWESDLVRENMLKFAMREMFKQYIPKG